MISETRTGYVPSRAPGACPKCGGNVSGVEVSERGSAYPLEVAECESCGWRWWFAPAVSLKAVSA